MNILHKSRRLALLLLTTACSWQTTYTMEDPLKELRRGQEAKYKLHLSGLYESACQQGNIDWLKSNRDLLLEKHIVGRDELDTLLETLQAPQKEAREKERKQAEQRIIAEQTYTARMKAAKTPQMALKEGIANLYELRAGKKDIFYHKLIATAGTENLERFFNLINELQQNSAIMDKVGQELQQLHSHMLYRVWESAKDLTSNKDVAFKVFQNAIAYKDTSAMINIYRDFLKNSPFQGKALDAVYNNFFMPAIERNDTTALIDLYTNFFSNSDRQEAALLLLVEYAQTRIQKGDRERLQMLLICFENTAYEEEMKKALQQLTGRISPRGSSPKSTLYNEWQAACTNRDLEKLLQLRDEAIRQGIVEQDMANAIIESLVQ